MSLVDFSRNNRWDLRAETMKTTASMATALSQALGIPGTRDRQLCSHILIALGHSIKEKGWQGIGRKRKLRMLR